MAVLRGHRKREMFWRKRGWRGQRPRPSLRAQRSHAAAVGRPPSTRNRTELRRRLARLLDGFAALAM